MFGIMRSRRREVVYEQSVPELPRELTGIEKMELEQKRVRDEEDRAAKAWQRKDALEKIANLRKW